MRGQSTRKKNEKQNNERKKKWNSGSKIAFILSSPDNGVTYFSISRILCNSWCIDIKNNSSFNLIKQIIRVQSSEETKRIEADQNDKLLS